ncbi:U32 family peptidase [Planococcaceae bacterium Storch 2/2-2]|nr:U32 family peptidase [Planococcaceae bacterium Storch 2/2-2]
MIQIIATAESVEQGKQLIDRGVDYLYVGEDEFGLRLPHSFSIDEIEELVRYAHAQEKKVIVAVNAILHNDRVEKVRSYLKEVDRINADLVTLGDPGAIRILQTSDLDLGYIYDAQTMVTSSNQINFFARRGASGSVLAREIPYEEMVDISKNVEIPVETLVYGATCIHQSKRNLVQNYFNYVGKEVPESMDSKELFVSEHNEDNHYSIYEDINGTHVFATDDVNLMEQLDKLVDINFTHWKLDGIFTPGEAFVDIASLFIEARNHFEQGTWNDDVKHALNERLHELHPAERSLDEGFFLKDPDSIQSS